MRLPGTLPISSTWIGALRLPLVHPMAFVAAALPFCLGTWLAQWVQDTFPLSSWPEIIHWLLTLMLWTLMVTNWHRLILLGETPSWRWGKRELRYTVIALIVVIAVVIPPIALGAIVQGFGTLLLSQLSELPAVLALPLGLALGLLPLLFLFVAAFKSMPFWLWLPSEALGRDESYDDFCAMAQGDRMRLFLVNAVAFLVSGIVMICAQALKAPSGVMPLISVASGVLQIGTLSLCYGHLSRKVRVTEGTETAPS